MIDLTNNDKKLLSYLAFHGPTIGNQIETMQNASRTSMKLEEEKLIKRAPDKYDLSPRPAMMLSLTVEGLARALLGFFMKDNAIRLVDRPTLDELNMIVKQWIDLIPEVFEKWTYFRNEGIDHIAAGRLVYAALSLADETESIGRAGILWTPKPNTTSEEHMKVVFTRFFYDVIYDPTFFRIAYLAKWIQSQREKNLDVRDAPLLLWVDVLKNDPDTKKRIDDNIMIAKGEIERFRVLSALLRQDKVDIAELEESFALAFRVFYS
jgi:hypothetical protein